MSEALLSVFATRRDSQQKNVVDAFTHARGDQITIVELPTGSGKTHVGIKAALAKRQKSSRGVIISTNSNENLFRTVDMAREHYGLTEEDFVVEIGRKHYVNFELLYDSLDTESALVNNLTRHQLAQQYATGPISDLSWPKDVLLYRFIETFGLDPEDIAPLVYLQASDQEAEGRGLSAMEARLAEGKIVFTNHAHLFLLMMTSSKTKKKSLLNSTPLILDEFHTLSDAADAILAKDFSLFRLVYSIEDVLAISGIESVLPKTIRERLLRLRSESRNTLKRVSMVNDEEKIITVIEALRSMRSEYEPGKLAKALSRTKPGAWSRGLSQTSVELHELQRLPLRSPRSRIDFSPKGYPRMSVTDGFAPYKLHNGFWAQHQGPALGLSGTLRTQRGSDREAFLWSLERAGLYRGGEVIPGTLFEEDEALQRRVDSIKVMRFESLFDRRRLGFCIVSHPELRYPLYAGDETQKKVEVWQKGIGRFVALNSNGSSLVLVPSYSDAEGIGRSIMQQLPAAAVSIATNDRKMRETVQQHVNAVAQGRHAILVGTKQYFTGLDLHGGLLEELYIAKAPFKPPRGRVSSKRYPNLSFTKKEFYENEAFFQFLQGAGRPIRDYRDRALMFVLDDRIDTPARQNYLDALDERGIRYSYTDLLANRSALLGREGDMDGLLVLFLGVVGMVDRETFIMRLGFSSSLQQASVTCMRLHLLGVRTKQFGVEKIRQQLDDPRFVNGWSILLNLALFQYAQVSGREESRNIAQAKLFGYANAAEFAENLFCSRVSPEPLADFLKWYFEV